MWMRKFVPAKPNWRLLSTQAQPAAQTVERDAEWDSALPFSKIPGPNLVTFFKNFLPGGRYHGISLIDMHKKLREDYGTLIKLPGMLGRKELVFSFNPDDYEKVFRTEGIWPTRRGLDSFVYYREHIRKDIFKDMGGLLTEQGERWHTMRMMVNPVMLQPKAVKLYVPKVDEVARDYMQILADMRDENNETPANFSAELNRWALESMGVIALDTRLGVLKSNSSTEAEFMIRSIRNMFELIYQLDVMPSIWKYYKTPAFVKLMKTFDDLTSIVMKRIDAAVINLEKNPTKNESEQSVLEKLLKIDKHVAIVMVFDMLIAGVDTTSSASIGILYCLAKNPEKQEKLREELRTILPDKNSPLTVENMLKMPYLRAVIKEGLRIHPPVVGNARAAGRDIVLQGYQIPKGVDVASSSMLLQNDDVFFPKSSQFIPERWLKNTTAECPSGRDSHPFIYLPFGFGSRTCIGRRFAILEIEVIVSRIIRQFNIEWNHPPIQFRSSLINTPSGDIRFKLTEIDN